MATIEQRAAAFRAFEARAEFVKLLAKQLGIGTACFGVLLLDGHPKANAFYDALEQYDADCKANQAAQDADRADAEAEANQGHQALHDDE